MWKRKYLWSSQVSELLSSSRPYSKWVLLNKLGIGLGVKMCKIATNNMLLFQNHHRKSQHVVRMICKGPSPHALMDASAARQYGVWLHSRIAVETKISLKTQFGWDLPQPLVWNFPVMPKIIWPETHWLTTTITNSWENCLEAGWGFLGWPPRRVRGE